MKLSGILHHCPVIILIIIPPVSTHVGMINSLVPMRAEASVWYQFYFV